MTDKLDLLIEQFGLETKTDKRKPVDTKQIIIDGQEVTVNVYATANNRKPITMKSFETRQYRSGYKFKME